MNSLHKVSSPIKIRKYLTSPFHDLFLGRVGVENCDQRGEVPSEKQDCVRTCVYVGGVLKDMF